MKNLLKFILIILLLALLIGAAIFIAKSDLSSAGNSVPTEDTALMISIDGEILNENSLLPVESSLRIDVNCSEYTVEIIAGSAAFDFRHNESLVKFPYVDGNFNDVFEVVEDEKFFTMNAAKRSMTMILESLYPGEEIIDISTLDESAAYFILRVSGNGETIEIPLTGFYEFMKIELDKTEIIF